jgi:Metallo-peptidase family M12B Reprolysin-like
MRVYQQQLALLVHVALLGSVDCILNFFPKVAEKISEARATNCVNGKRCRFITNGLKLNVTDTIKLSVKEKGRQILCKRQLTQRPKNWYGSCDGDAEDANFVRRTDVDGNERVYGSIRVGDEICQIAPNANGEDEINCQPQSTFRDDHPPVRVPETRLLGESSYNESFYDNFIAGFTLSQQSNAALRGSGRSLYDDSGKTIDIMVVWTMDAECANSKLDKGCTLTNLTETNMRGLVQLAIAETNTAFELSGVATQLRLVHAYRDPDYVETSTPPTGATTQDVTLDHLSSRNDGNLDSVHAKRVLYGADMVHIMVAGAGYCGLAYGGPDINWAFSLSHFSCATGYYSFGHELAHNMNSAHDRGTENTCTQTGTYNYGYRDPNAEFRSILGLDCNVGQCDNLAKAGCPRVQRFSNTFAPYNGKAIGSATQNNARNLNEQVAKVAAFFPAMNCQIDSDCNDRNPYTINSCNKVNGACVFTPTTTPVDGEPIGTKAPVSAAPVTPKTLAPVRSPPRTASPVRSITTAAPNRPTPATPNPPIAAPVRPTTPAPISSAPISRSTPIATSTPATLPVTTAAPVPTTPINRLPVGGSIVAPTASPPAASPPVPGGTATSAETPKKKRSFWSRLFGSLFGRRSN